MFNKHLPLLHGNVSILPEVRFFLPPDAGNAAVQRQIFRIKCVCCQKSCCVWAAASHPLSVKKGFGNTRRRFRIPSQKYNSLHYAQSATTTTAASGGNREELLGQRPARRACRSRHDADAGSRNPASGGHFKSSRIKQGRRTKYCAAAGVRMRYAKYSCARRAASLMQSRSWSSVSNFLLGLR